MAKPQLIERFKKRTIIFHWIHTVSFLALVVTGAILYIPGLGEIAAGGLTRIIHRIAVIFFAGIPVVYFIFNPKISLQFIKETLTWGVEDVGWLKAAPLYYFGGPEENMPPQGHINTGQKMWQLIILGTGGLFIITGFVMWFLKEAVTPGLFQWCVVAHDVAFLLAFLMLLVHIYLGTLHPRMNESFISMIKGKVSEKYAKGHYGKWYDKVTKTEK